MSVKTADFLCAVHLLLLLQHAENAKRNARRSETRLESMGPSDCYIFTRHAYADQNNNSLNLFSRRSRLIRSLRPPEIVYCHKNCGFSMRSLLVAPVTHTQKTPCAFRGDRQHAWTRWGPVVAAISHSTLVQTRKNNLAGTLL